MTYTSSKVIELGSTAFRQPNADSHCKFIHGYQLKAELTFGCKELDKNNWVFDFGGLKQLKTIFNNQFDHTLVVAGNDPNLDLFTLINEAGVADLRIMDGGVGIERFAEWVFKTADTYVEEATEGRVWVENATVYEHGNNFASVSKSITENTTYVNEEGTKEHVKAEEIPESKELPLEQQKELETQQQEQPPSKGAHVGSNVTRGNFSDPFKGTSWGN
jgi:6-pyruvoyltetrahydropterin/6-carboxytetrahydropterin synthase